MLDIYPQLEFDIFLECSNANISRYNDLEKNGGYRPKTIFEIMQTTGTSHVK